jgi:hypothetical protein
MRLLAPLMVTLVATWWLVGCGGAEEKAVEKAEREAGVEEAAPPEEEIEGENFIQGSGNVTRESREVSGFTEVALNGIGTLTIRRTASESLTIEAEDNIIPRLTTEVENGRLTIGVEPNTNIQTTEPINYELTVRDLSTLQMLGAGNIDARSISTDNLEIANSGSGEINLANIDTGSLKLTSGGSGEVKTAGRTGSQDVEVLGSGDYQGEDLKSEEARVDVRGSGEAFLNVSDSLDVRIIGSGSVEYVGDPTISQEILGAGELRRR